jgi:pimeloyl-ACP methyl ester carboxylesterase
MFVTAVGGPGGSGLAVADTYTAAFDPSITEAFDVVFFDQRGLGASGGQQCVAAAAANYGAEYDPQTAAGETELARDAEQFARDCPAEMGNPEILPYLGTEQAIEDLEVFRSELGDDRFWLYGESYGTQFAQTYAAKYGERLAGLVLDGPVDLTLSGLEYYAEQATAFGEVLARTLSACAEDEACLDDMGGDPLQAYDSLAARLRVEPAAFGFPLPSGGLATRSFSFGDLEAGAASYAYSEGSRMLFLRALAASTTGELAPLARIAYDSLSLDPETLAPLADPGWSDAVSYAVECNDYDYGPAETYLRTGDAVDANVPRLGSVFYGDLPCAFWPEDGYDPGRPEPLAAPGVPVLVLVGTADPATPLPNALRILERLADGYLVVQEGGPHVIFGWGNACVDNLVTGFLVRGQLPERETSCYGAVIDDYVPLPPDDAADFASPLEALDSAETEIAYLPEYYYWDGETPFAVGCPFGGTLAVEPSPAGETYTFSRCAFSRGFEMTGTGAFDYESTGLRLELAVDGLHRGELVYTRDGDGSTRVTGEYGGEAVDSSR